MKAITRIAVAAFVFSLCLVGNQAMAGNNYGMGKASGGVSHEGRGLGLYADICAGQEIVIEGIVSEAEFYTGQGIKIDVGDDVKTVYGIGPLRYWDSLDISRPVVGDYVVVTAREVAFSDGTIKNIAISIAFDTGVVVDLRDENCIPNWRRGN